MKKLKFIAGGQPFRSTDFEVLQNANLQSFMELLNGMTNELAILSGVESDTPVGEYVNNTLFTISAGYVYDLVEICRVPTATFNYNASNFLYLRLQVLETSERLIGGSPLAVLTERLYNLQYYSGAAVGGDISLISVPRLAMVTKDALLIKPGGHLSALKAGFTPSVGYGLYCHQSDCGEALIRCTFTTNTVNGALCEPLPAEMRPKVDTLGFFKSNNIIQPLMVKADGNVEVTGATTTGSNVIMFRYSTEFTL